MMRIVWYVALACMAIVVIGVQLDRQSKRDPALAALVPPPFRADAHLPLLLLSGARRDYAVATAHGRALVRDRPFPAENLSYLGQIETARGDAEAAARALTEAGLRGWREPMVQMALAVSALDQDKPDDAALRAEALLSTGQLHDTALRLVAVLLSTPEGTDAFARRLATQPRWLNEFVQGRMTRGRPEDLARTMMATERMDPALPCDVLRQTAKTLISGKREDLAGQVVPMRCIG